jgi:hypothetical protein
MSPEKDHPDCVVEPLPGDRVLKTYSYRGGSDEHPTILHFWHIGSLRPEHHWLQAIFSLTFDLKDQGFAGGERYS